MSPDDTTREASDGPSRQTERNPQTGSRVGSKTGRGGVGSLALVFALARVTLVAALCWGLAFNVSEVRGNSMRPGIEDGDRILVNHLSFWLGGVERGDVVVMRYPLDPALDYIKRVVGLPGDEIRIRDGLVHVNGKLLDEPYLGESDPYTRLLIIVDPGTYFVLGDNRLRSSDSREFGFVPEDFVRGKVEVRIWPPSRVGLIP
jgi:signal peptidase I